MKPIELVIILVILFGAYVFFSNLSLIRAPFTCMQHGGRWLWQYNECEGITQAKCNEIGGKFYSCTSACRHATEPGPCIMVCVQVCDFK
jgi:hypothetical protein